jgi:hypothetical protein
MFEVTNLADGSTSTESIIALIIPLVAIIMGIGVAMLGIWLDFRKKREIFQLHHAERMAAIDKGIDVPPLPPQFFQDGRRAQTPFILFRRGLTFLLVGATLTLALYFQAGSHRQALWGLLLVAVGVSNLVSAAVGRRLPQEPAAN